MLLITCPHCGPREETEFACGGEAHIARPLAENSISDAEFADYLFLRDNPKGLFLERWRHTAGCRRWFNIARDTVSHEIIEVYAMGSLPAKKGPRATYDASWRRQTAAEKAALPIGAKPAAKKGTKKPVAEKPAQKAAQKAVAKKGAKKAAPKTATTSRATSRGTK